MYEFHKNVERYHEIQVLNSRDYVIPFIEKIRPVGPELCVLEIGCAEGGVLKAFLERGCEGYGIELEPGRLENAKKFMSAYVASGKAHFLNINIYDFDPVAENWPRFDVIILKDVIEHIPEQDKLLREIKKFLAKDGLVFIGFPPWHMPFGGHQQVCKSFLSKVPYLHLLPKPVYYGLLKYFGENVEAFAEVRDTRLTINQFIKFSKNSGFRIAASDHYLVNPIYKYKFGVPAYRQFGIINKIPFVRDFFTTCVYYLITPV
ncbi:MAG: hypothetical protein RL386_105 [Bacteroidota bacterium]|jgi:SAM-dependent methyltransferase